MRYRIIIMYVPSYGAFLPSTEGKAVDDRLRYNIKRVKDRQTDALIGMSKGLTATGRIELEEAEALLNWLHSHLAVVDGNPFLEMLACKVSKFLEDGDLDDREERELFLLLSAFNGEATEAGEILKPTRSAFDDPMPEVVFLERTFVFTGEFLFGKRSECAQVTEAAGALVKNTVTRATDFLIVGTYASAAWAHENFGRKIEKAIVQRDEQGLPLAIISEQHWLDHLPQ